MNKVLIIGQGIAGALLARMLRQRGVDVRLADGALPGSASLAAAGIINPVTGKRFVKSWRFGDFFPVARATYTALSQELGVDIWSETAIVRLLTTAEERNDWSARCALPEYASYLSDNDGGGAWKPLTGPDWHFGRIHQAARVNFPALLAAFREKAQAEGWFEQRNYTPEEAAREARYYDAVVFCEGYRGATNPFFPGIQWQIAKGEALIVRIDDPQAGNIAEMLKKTVMLAPLGQGRFWAGGSYQWHYADLLPSREEGAYLEKHLAGMLTAPYKIVGQMAGVRPTVRDRRPLLGRSPLDPKLYIFNGMGTKGALLAPYWAAHLADHLLEQTPLDPEVDIRRFGGI